MNLTEGSAALYYEWQTDGTSTWNKETVAAGNYRSAPALSIQSNGNVLIAETDEDTGTLIPRAEPGGEIGVDARGQSLPEWSS